MAWALCLIATAALVVPAVTAGPGFDRDTFKQFVTLRAGTGAPVYWYAIGEVYSSPEGKRLLRIEGSDTARMIAATEPDTAIQLSRKVFIYRDPETNEILKEYKGQPVVRIAYPYQFITYKLVGDRLTTFVEQGAGANLQKIGPGDNFLLRRLGPSLVFSSPLFLNMETPRGHYEAYENYDFVYHPAEQDPAAKHQLIWNRVGDLPAFVGKGKAVIQMVGWRVDRFEDLPASIREYVKAEAPLWMQPPKDLDEIRSLQK
ncbi:MAG: DUF1838 family protein [Acidobacteria bacterium]|nr:DUF1838 family protein [Acidobacteriota bacterium]